MVENKLDVITAGMIVFDIIGSGIEKFAEPGELMFVPGKIEVHTGGHPLNVAIDLTKLGLDGKNIGVIAAVGKDFVGDFLENSIKSYDINSFLQRNEHDTSKNIIFVIPGENRRFHVDPGANLGLEAEYVKKTLREYNPKVFCCRPGYSGIDLEIESIYREIEDSLIMLDVCSPFEKQLSYLDSALKYVDVFHGNDEEAMKLTETDSKEGAIDYLLDKGIKTLLITIGGEGAEYITKKYRVKQPSFSIDAVDPSGAGDAFCSGFITKYLQYGFKGVNEIDSNKAQEILMYSQAVGACAASASGCSSGVSKENVKKLISEQGDRLIKETKLMVY